MLCGECSCFSSILFRCQHFSVLVFQLFFVLTLIRVIRVIRGNPQMKSSIHFPYAI
jgi:hypothetical protein